MWVDTYDFVRLHQPYPIFTAGNIGWQLGKHASHLATRDEVLDHLRHCVEVARTKVDLEKRFGWEYIEHAEADGAVTVTLRGPDGRIETLTTKRLIKAYGNHVLPSSPMPLSSAAVRSTTPEELPGVIAKRPEDSGPVWIIGSGKTAMDVALMLRRECPGRELNMVAGSGTISAVARRSSRPARGAGTAALASTRCCAKSLSVSMAPTSKTSPRGSSTPTASARLPGRPLLQRVPIRRRVRRRTSGVQRLEAGHLDDVVDTADGPSLALRDGRSLAIPADSWVVNCTGYLARPGRPYEPFVSDTGNVLSIQLRSSITGPFTSFAGYHLTHLHVPPQARAARLYELDLEDLATKSRSAIIWAAITLAMYNLGRFARALPPKVMIDCGLDRWSPRAGGRRGHRAPRHPTVGRFPLPRDPRHARPAVRRAGRSRGPPRDHGLGANPFQFCSRHGELVPRLRRFL